MGESLMERHKRLQAEKDAAKKVEVEQAKKVKEDEKARKEKEKEVAKAKKEEEKVRKLKEKAEKEKKAKEEKAKKDAEKAKKKEDEKEKKAKEKSEKANPVRAEKKDVAKRDTPPPARKAEVVKEEGVSGTATEEKKVDAGDTSCGKGKGKAGAETPRKVKEEVAATPKSKRTNATPKSGTLTEEEVEALDFHGFDDAMLEEGTPAVKTEKDTGIEDFDAFEMAMAWTPGAKPAALSEDAAADKEARDKQRRALGARSAAVPHEVSVATTLDWDDDDGDGNAAVSSVKQERSSRKQPPMGLTLQPDGPSAGEEVKVKDEPPAATRDPQPPAKTKRPGTNDDASADLLADGSSAKRRRLARGSDDVLVKPTTGHYPEFFSIAPCRLCGYPSSTLEDFAEHTRACLEMLPATGFGELVCGICGHASTLAVCHRAHVDSHVRAAGGQKV